MGSIFDTKFFIPTYRIIVRAIFVEKSLKSVNMEIAYIIECGSFILLVFSTFDGSARKLLFFTIAWLTFYLKIMELPAARSSRNSSLTSQVFNTLWCCANLFGMTSSVKVDLYYSNRTINKCIKVVRLRCYPSIIIKYSEHTC